MRDNSTNFIEFTKKRDLGTIISDTFNFLKYNWKSFFGTIFRISVPALIVYVLALVYYMYSFTGIFPKLGQPDFENNITSLNFLGAMAFSGLILIVAITVAYALLTASTLYYIKSYVENAGKINKEEVYRNVKVNFWSFVGLSLLVFILIFISAMLCFFPVLYTGPVLLIAFPILVFEKKGVIEAIGHCFTITKNKWLSILGIIIIISIILYIINIIISIPTFVYQFTKTPLFGGNPMDMINLFNDPIYLSLYIISSSFQFLLSSITFIVSVFIYFDIVGVNTTTTNIIDEIKGIGRD